MIINQFGKSSFRLASFICTYFFLWLNISFQPNLLKQLSDILRSTNQSEVTRAQAGKLLTRFVFVFNSFFLNKTFLNIKPFSSRTLSTPKRRLSRRSIKRGGSRWLRKRAPTLETTASKHSVRRPSDHRRPPNVSATLLVLSCHACSGPTA